MSVSEILEQRKGELHGRVIGADEADALAARLGAAMPPGLAALMQAYPLCGTAFALDADEDESGLGVEMQWFTPAQMIEEALEYYPGILATPLGYLPIGMCLEGSGDPYFIKSGEDGDPPVVRIPHDAAAGAERLDLGQIETVSPRLSEFLHKATIGP